MLCTYNWKTQFLDPFQDNGYFLETCQIIGNPKNTLNSPCSQRRTPEKTIFKVGKMNLDQNIDFDLAKILTLKRVNLWTKFLTSQHAYIYVYMYIYICCEVIIWAKFGHFRCYYLGQVGVIIWAKLFLAYKNSGFKRFFAHTVII